MNLPDDLDDDRPYVESRFRARANEVRGYRKSPWHALELTPAPPVEESAPWQVRWQDSFLYRWSQRLQDTLVGWQDRWSRRNRQRPSYAAQEEWWAYYQGLYQSHDPDVATFDRLLRRRGAPDWTNPHPYDELAHYDYHPDGLMLADAEAVLRAVRLRWGGPPGDPQDDLVIQRQGQKAACCLALALAHAAHLPILLGEVGPENRALLVTEAALSDVRAYGVQPRQVLKGARRCGWVSAEDLAVLQPLILKVAHP